MKIQEKYNVFLLSRLYLKDYYKFVVNETNVSKSSDILLLFMYSMKKLYNLETVEYCSAIGEYGDECVKYLESVPNTPKDRDSLSFEDKVKLVSVCEGYAHAMNILSKKCMISNRLKEGKVDD